MNQYFLFAVYGSILLAAALVLLISLVHSRITRQDGEEWQLKLKCAKCALKFSKADVIKKMNCDYAHYLHETCLERLREIIQVTALNKKCLVCLK